MSSSRTRGHNRSPSSSDDRTRYSTAYNTYNNNNNNNDNVNHNNAYNDDNDNGFSKYGLSARRYRRESFRLPGGSGLGFELGAASYDYGRDYGDGQDHGNGYGYDNDYDVNEDELVGEASRLRGSGTGAGAEDARAKHQSGDSSNSAAHLLSWDTLVDEGAQGGVGEEGKGFGILRSGKRRQQRKQALLGDFGPESTPQDVTRDVPKGRIVSGAYLEEGQDPDMQVRHRGGGPAFGSGSGIPEKSGVWEGSAVSAGSGSPPFWRQKRWWIGMGLLLVVLVAIVVPVVVVMTRRHDGHSGSSANADEDGDDEAPANLNLQGISRDSIPDSAKGTVLDPFSWYDTTDLNVTYTNETVGGLPVMGLNSTWDDSARPNEHVPPLNEPFPYGAQPIRGVNLGGWLSIEPFIVPSLFEKYESSEGIVDEWTLTRRLGSSAASTLEKHYAKFITEQDFIDIRDAGLDHVRIQYSYWAVKLYADEPYVSRISWRYLLRAIEYCRKYGLRVKLDLHGLVGSQNGWNHSGREGQIAWLNGSDGALNRNRSLSLHDQLSTFFAQDRYKNVVTIYGLVNEPLMLSLPIRDVLDWTTEVTRVVQGNNMTAWIAFHDGFLNLSKWKKMLKSEDVPGHMMLDTHQYTIFNTGQIVVKHADRVNLVCNDWFHMIREINSTTDGYVSFYISLLSIQEN